jgi:hypothetical protein
VRPRAVVELLPGGRGWADRHPSRSAFLLPCRHEWAGRRPCRSTFLPPRGVHHCPSSPCFLRRDVCFLCWGDRVFASPSSTVPARQMVICLAISHCLVGLSLTFLRGKPWAAPPLPSSMMSPAPLHWRAARLLHCLLLRLGRCSLLRRDEGDVDELHHERSWRAHSPARRGRHKRAPSHL